MATPHINANKGDFAKTVLMPGDPKRAQFIAQNFLTDAKLVNDVRGVQGYTGFYNGKRVSVMASGMGVPSFSIYAYELFNFFDVQTIIRVGSAGALKAGVKPRDLIIAQGACTNSNFASQYNLNGTFAPIGSFDLIQKAYEIAKRQNLNALVGNVFTSDVFYCEQEEHIKWRDMEVLAVEMECAALYTLAAKHGKKALCICTISDCPFTGESLTPQQRQTEFSQMIKLALEVAED